MRSDEKYDYRISVIAETRRFLLCNLPASGKRDFLLWQLNEVIREEFIDSLQLRNASHRTPAPAKANATHAAVDKPATGKSGMLERSAEVRSVPVAGGAAEPPENPLETAPDSREL